MKIIATNDIISINLLYGANRYFYSLTSSLARRGHAVELVLPVSAGENADGIRKLFPEVTIREIPLAGSAAVRGAKAIFGLRKAMMRRIAEEKFDIALFFQPKTAMGPLLFGPPPPVARVYHFLSPWATEFELKTGGKKDIRYAARVALEKRMLMRCDAIVPMSQFMNAQMLAMHPEVKARRIGILPGGAEIDRFCPPADRAEARRLANMPQDRFVLFTARQFTPRTGLDMLVDAMRAVVKSHPDVLLIMGGQGPQKAELEQRARDYGLENHIRFEGYITEELLPVYYGAADLFVLPTRALEGFGLVTVEAMAAGTPVCATPAGANSEICGGFCKELVAEEITEEALAECLIRWLGQRERLEAMRAECRLHAEDTYSWEIVAECMENFYAQVIADIRK